MTPVVIRNNVARLEMGNTGLMASCAGELLLFQFMHMLVFFFSQHSKKYDDLNIVEFWSFKRVCLILVILICGW